MKLAIVSLVYKLTLPESKGGAEVWISNFALECARRDHQIDLYAVKGSMEGGNITLISTLDKPVSEYYEDEYFRKPDASISGRRAGKFTSTIYARILNQVRKREMLYDVIIDSTASPLFSFNADTLDKPVLTIGHDPPDFASNFYAKVFGWPSNSVAVFPSQFQRDRAEFIPESKRVTIPHGIELKSFKHTLGGRSHMLWMSRIDYPHMDKGVSEAMHISKVLDRQLRASGYVERSSRNYVEETLKPLITQNVMFEEQNALAPMDKNSVFGSARLFLFPTKWEEPFGIVLLESMACGTPVVAYARGAIPEIVIDGVTGFVVNPSEDDIRGKFVVKKTGIEGLCEAVERIYAMGPGDYAQMRKDCRSHVEQHFTVQRMVDEYERLFQRLKR